MSLMTCTPTARGRSLRVLLCLTVLLSLAFGAWCDAKLDAQGRGRALRSRVVYPPQRIALRMDHAHPAHRALRCERCHEGASAARSAP